MSSAFTELNGYTFEQLVDRLGTINLKTANIQELDRAVAIIEILFFSDRKYEAQGLHDLDPQGKLLYDVMAARLASHYYNSLIQEVRNRMSGEKSKIKEYENKADAAKAVLEAAYKTFHTSSNVFNSAADVAKFLKPLTRTAIVLDAVLRAAAVVDRPETFLPEISSLLTGTIIFSGGVYLIGWLIPGGQVPSLAIAAFKAVSIVVLSMASYEAGNLIYATSSNLLGIIPKNEAEGEILAQINKIMTLISSDGTIQLHGNNLSDEERGIIVEIAKDIIKQLDETVDISSLHDDDYNTIYFVKNRSYITAPSDGNDLIIGTGADEIIYGVIGQDAIFGFGGEDVIHG